MNGPSCPSGKLGYAKRDDAAAAAHRRLGSKREPPALLRIYRCRYCQRYHLTSTVPRKWRGDERVPAQKG